MFVIKRPMIEMLRNPEFWFQGFDYLFSFIGENSDRKEEYVNNKTWFIGLKFHQKNNFYVTDISSVISFDKPTINNEKVFMVSVIEVLDKYKKCGYGKAMLEYVEGIAKEDGFKDLFVYPNEDAKGFYEKLRFEEDLNTPYWRKKIK